MLVILVRLELKRLERLELAVQHMKSLQAREWLIKCIKWMSIDEFRSGNILKRVISRVFLYLVVDNRWLVLAERSGRLPARMVVPVRVGWKRLELVVQECL